MRYGTLWEVALGLQFGNRVFGLDGAAAVKGVLHFHRVEDVLLSIALEMLGVGT